MRSHIVPEFLHGPLYDAKHRAHLVDFLGSSRLLQKGLRESLLCEECESLIQPAEDYFARYWYKRHPIPDRLAARELLLTGIDYRLFKLFLLSIIWRASVSTLPDFNGAALGSHEDPIRRLVLEQSPGPEDKYPVYAGLIVDPRSRRLWDEVILHPLKIRVRGHWVIRLVFGGASWSVMTSSHQTLPLESHFLTSNGELRFTVFTGPEFAETTGLTDVMKRWNPRQRARSPGANRHKLQ